MYGYRIELVPERDIKTMRGFLKGINIAFIRNEDSAIQAIAVMKQGKVIDLSQDIALQAAKISLDFKLPMADSIILATAAKYEAMVWTQDADFKGKPFVKYFAK